MRHSSRRLACIVAVSTATLAARAFAQPAGWTPAWSDEFLGTAVDANRWERLNRRDSFNNEKQYYRPEQATVSGGQLRLTATNQPLDGKAYRSGLVRTWAEQTYGRWETRASLPTGQGMWPAIWLLPRNANWPQGGEIDIMENRGSQPTVVGHAYHYGNSVANHQYVARDFGYSANGTPVSFHGSMHTYAVEWDPSRIKYFVDGVPSYTLYRTVPVSATPMSLILNLAVGGDYGGDPNASTQFPQTFSVDHVRVFDRDGTTRAISNGSFESKSGSLFQEWDESSNGGGNVLPDSVAANARTGSTAAQLYGRFNGSASNVSSLHQEVPTTPGEVWQAGAWSRNRPGDVLAGDNTARIRIEFIDENGAVIPAGSGTLTTVTAASPTDYREGVVRREAPAGAKWARAVLEFRQVGNAVGAANFDDATLRRFSATSVDGDVNFDGVRDAADLDALNHSLTADNAAFDFDANLLVNAADVDALLASAFDTVRGDANLNGSVDFDDLLRVAGSYGVSGTWATGDFDGNSTVGFDDLLAVGNNYGTSNFWGDWALAQSLVPEPTTITAAMSASVAITSRKRRRG